MISSITKKMVLTFTIVFGVAVSSYALPMYSLESARHFQGLDFIAIVNGDTPVKHCREQAHRKGYSDIKVGVYAIYYTGPSEQIPIVTYTGVPCYGF